MSYELIPLPEFERQVKRLQRKYRNIKSDLIFLQQVLQPKKENIQVSEIAKLLRQHGLW